MISIKNLSKENEALEKLGFLIVFEGLDAVGKTTQAKILQEKISKSYKHQVFYTHQPSASSHVSRKLKQVLERSKDNIFSEKKKVKELYDLFLEDRKYQLKNEIIPKLEKNVIVVLDRYFFSTFVYQHILSLEKMITDHKNFPKPDIVILLDLDVESIFTRISKRSNKITHVFENNRKYLEKIRKKFLQLKDQNEIKKYFINDFFLIEGNQGQEALSNIIFDKVKLVLEKKFFKRKGFIL